MNLSIIKAILCVLLTIWYRYQTEYCRKFVWYSYEILIQSMNVFTLFLTLIIVSILN